MMEQNQNVVKPIFISLYQASSLCDYSQKYLNLRARQGKLRAEKIGRNWLTTHEWLQDYIKKVEEYKNGSQKFGETEPEEFSPPFNLPTESSLWQERYIAWQRYLGKVTAELAGTFVLASLILLSGIVVGRENIQTGLLQFQDSGKIAQQKLTDRALVLGAQMDNNIPFLGPMGDLAWQYFDWLKDSALAFSHDVDTWYTTTNDNLNYAIVSDAKTYAKVPQSFAKAVSSLVGHGIKLFARQQPQQQPTQPPSQQPQDSSVYSVLASELSKLRDEVSELRLMGGIPGPRGPQGQQGQQGSPGLQGAPGLAGVQGSQGPMGGLGNVILTSSPPPSIVRISGNYDSLN
ncbi:MAG: hypothetical protein Q7R48_00270, partial [bacterium]|nr:hypothetical protein [bacterium]